MTTPIHQPSPDQDDRLEAKIGAILYERQLTIAVAESCTGGLIAHRLTNIAGSSVYMMGGFVVYSNQAKIQFAGVKAATIDEFGAVSEPTARELAQGTRQAFNTALALSVTGIAGPGGGSAKKPVGLTYIGLCAMDEVTVQRFVWDGNREANKAQSAEAALQMLYDYLRRDLR